jgi:hypothetical protein
MTERPAQGDGMTERPEPERPPVARWAVPLALAVLALVLGLGFALARDSPAPLAIALAFAWAAWATR